MTLRQRVQHAHSLAGNGEDDATAIGRILVPPDQALSHGAVSQLYNAVLPQAESFGEEVDCRGSALWNACDLQEELMLARLQVMIVRHLLAELQEAAEVIAKLREGLQEGSLVDWEISFGHTIYIVSRYK
jgi:hypothetical protein